MRAFAATLLAALTCAGCGGGSSARIAGPVLVVARVKDATSLDPAHETDGLSLTVTQEIYQNLVRFKPGTFDIEPGAAVAWKTARDGKSWTFRLARGLRFSDGTPLDARAVKFNFDRWRNTRDPNRGNFPYGYYASMFGGFDDNSVITSVEAPDPSTVVIRLKVPFGPLLRDVAMPSFALGSPSAIRRGGEAFGRMPVASGPYRLAEWDRDDHILLTANPRWSGPKPRYPNVYLLDIPDQSTSVLEMQKGDVDMLIDPRPDDAKALARQRDVRLYHPPSNNVSYLALNLDKKPFDNVLVRRAIAYAIDKQGLVRSFYAQGTVVADNWTPPGMLGENPAVKAYPHDLTAAKALLARAGVARFSTQLYYPTAPRPYMPEPQRIAESIQADLRALGIDVTLEPFEFAIFLHHVQNGDHPMCLIGWSGDNGDPDNFMYPLLDQDSAVKGQAQNYSFWRDPAFHKLMLAGQQTSDEGKRRVIYRQANAMIHDQAPAIPLAHSVVSFAAKTSVGGVTTSPDNSFNFITMKPKAGP
ncbi:MAG: ABC transporter substrate-binding protein [Candidatus Eremiobacteraeota bacterium]|nr:ABC transporter substrate-binding protein [Candidatus Eremiobacteraeota bacterium]